MMITYDDLVHKVQSYDKEVDIALLQDACQFSKEAHGEQKRASGDPYYYHPLEVANILADMQLDLNTIITALLHDTVEDTDVTLQDIEKEFGKQVKGLVDGVTKLAKIEYQSEHERQAENFRKLLVAMSEDIRVLLVKLADRLHNMRTLHYIKSPQKRLRIAHETIEIYAPLAERIGMQKLKNELHDLAFSEMHPEVRESIMSRLEYLRNHDSDLVDVILRQIEEVIHQEAPDLPVKILGREKTPSSIWRKMERKNISFEQLSDIMAYRFITDSVENCYRLLGIIHTNFKVVPERFKDFISTPKDNGYQSLHTVILGPEQRFVELQIRTTDMHAIAEFGVASHWAYKQKRDYSTDGKQYKWLRELLYILEHATDPEEFFENTKLEMYYDQVFCFTPKGDLVALPRGATPVDFAYEVHSKVGNHCAGSKVNGRIVPLATQLNNGDQVEIITSKTQVPSPNWERFVITGKAKSEIKRFVRAQKKEEYKKLGESLLQKKCDEMQIALTADFFKNACKQVRKKDKASLLVALGEGTLTSEEVLRALYPDKKVPKKRRNPLAMLSFSKEKKKKNNAIAIKGLTPGMAVYFADCCNPIPGDSIVGVVTTGKGMTVHTSDCEILGNFSNTPERLVDVSWDRDSSQDIYVGRIKVTLAHEAGALATLANMVSKGQGNINNLKVIERSKDYFVFLVDITVRGSSQLNTIIRSLRSSEMIHSVERFKKN